MAKYPIASTRKPLAELIKLAGIPSLTVLKVMLNTPTGNTTSAADFRAGLSSINFKRLSLHIHRLRKLVGADIEAVRDGRNIVAYKLANGAMFTAVRDNALEKPAKATKVAAPKVKVPVAPVATKTKAKAKPVVKAATAKEDDGIPEVLPISSVHVDADFDAVADGDLPDFLR